MTRGRYRVEYGAYAVVGSSSLSSPRIYVSPHVKAPAGEVDPVTNMPVIQRRQTVSRARRREAGPEARRVPLAQRTMGVSPNAAPGERGAGQAGASRTMAAGTAPRHQSAPGKGVALNHAMALIACLIFVLGIMTLVKVSEMTEKSKAMNSVLNQITQCKKENDELSVELAAANQDTDIWYSASQQLGMISSKGVSVVYLEAPQTRTAKAQEADVPPARSGIYATLFGFLN